MNVFQLILDGKCVKRPFFKLAGANCTTFIIVRCQVGLKKLAFGKPGHLMPVPLTC